MNSKEIVFALVMVLIAASSGLDLMTDISHGAKMDHVLKEGGIVLISLAIIIWLIIDIRVQSRKIRGLKQELEEIRHADRQPGPEVIEIRRRFHDVVNQQFRDWKLTASEAEVGWLLLKGLSLKEVAMIRNTLEKTVRQQASSIYRKSGVSGRHAFSAWFIEDLMDDLPDDLADQQTGKET
ncbi:MAG: DNA-binding response regulator [Gammaproteobacteria bacterium]|nr:MAG: DNA-binding response regulator [Gammaproteobacteria bacterium]